MHLRLDQDSLKYICVFLLMFYAILWLLKKGNEIKPSHRPHKQQDVHVWFDHSLLWEKNEPLSIYLWKVLYLDTTQKKTPDSA